MDTLLATMSKPFLLHHCGLINRSVCSWKDFLPSLIFNSKARANQVGPTYFTDKWYYAKKGRRLLSMININDEEEKVMTWTPY